MIVGLVVLALFGPPKLPPIGGRAVPAPVQPVVEDEPEPPPSEPSPSPTPEPPAPPAVTPETPPATTPETPPATGPELEANGPSSPTLATPRSLAGLQPPARAPATMRPPPAGKGISAAPLRLVSADEMSRWDREDAKPRPKAIATPTATGREGKDATVARTATPESPDSRPRFLRPPHPPDRSATVVLGYRYFRIKDGLGRDQDWHLASIEVTPMRRYVRLNLITEFGVEGGEAAASGDRADILLMERVGLGMQYPHVVTPFLEFQAGVGGARVELFGRNDVALLYALGLDFGAQFALGKWIFVHAAVGWIRPTFVWPQKTLSYDRVAFKLGIGF